LLERGIQYAAEDRVGTATMTQMFGAAGGALMAIAIMISGFGCCNGLILAGARVTTPWPRTDCSSRALLACILLTRRPPFP